MRIEGIILQQVCTVRLTIMFHFIITNSAFIWLSHVLPCSVNNYSLFLIISILILFSIQFLYFIIELLLLLLLIKIIA